MMKKRVDSNLVVFTLMIYVTVFVLTTEISTIEGFGTYIFELALRALPISLARALTVRLCLHILWIRGNCTYAIAQSFVK